MTEANTPTDLKQSYTPTDYQRRFKQARETAGLTLASVAGAVGCSLQAIAQFEKGVSSISLANFLKACEAMKVRTDWVLHGSGKMFDGAPPEPTRERGRPARRA